MLRDVDFIFAMSKDGLEETLSYSTTSLTFEEDNESKVLFPKVFCVAVMYMIVITQVCLDEWSDALTCARVQSILDVVFI